MGLLSILRTVAQKKLASTGDRPVQIQKTKVPLGLHQGSAIELPEIDLALAQADGSVIVVPTGTQIVNAVGHYKLWGMNIYNAYLGDGANYVQLACDQQDRVTEARLWCSRDEILPATVQDWEWWLGSWQKDANGKAVRDSNGKAIRADWGTIGWPQFQVDSTPPLLYTRTWSPGDAGVEPVAYTERVIDVQGNATLVSHEAMEYSRRLTDAADAVTESLLATVVQDQDGGSVNIFIGIPLDHQNLNILRS